jgi:hypothetical protein
MSPYLRIMARIAALILIALALLYIFETVRHASS